jgi:hypothetical protein
VTLDLSLPIVVVGGVTEALGVERVQLGVREHASP